MVMFLLTENSNLVKNFDPMQLKLLVISILMVNPNTVGQVVSQINENTQEYI